MSTTSLPSFRLPVFILLSITLISPFAHAGMSDNADDALFIEAGKTIERTIKGGESHAFRVQLRAGEALSIVVEQQDVDLRVSLSAPTGQSLVEVNSPNGTQGPERLYFIAEAEGIYVLAVNPASPAAGAGHYKLRVIDVRPADEQARVRFRAQQKFFEGLRERRGQTADSFRRGIEKFKAAAEDWRALGDAYGEAWAYTQMGLYHYFLVELAEARAFYDRALPLWRAAGDRNGEAIVFDRIATVSAYLGEMQSAIELFHRALELRRAVRDMQGESVTLTGLGNVYVAVGESQKGLAFLNEALPLRRAVGDRSGEAYTLNTLAVSYAMLGENRRARENYETALQLRRDVGDKRGEARTLNGLGAVLAADGERARALECFVLALELSRTVGDRYAQSDALSGIGEAHLSEGRMREAVPYLEEVAKIRKEVTDRQGEAAALVRIGAAQQKLNEHAKARASFDAALPLARAVIDRHGEANVLYHLARLERDVGNLEQARQRIEEALSIIESLRGSVANPKLRASYFAAAQRDHEFYVDLLMRMAQAEPSRGLEAEALHANEKARARSLLDMLVEARADIRQGVDRALVERERELQRLLEAKADRRIQILSRKHTDEEAGVIAREIGALEAEYQELTARIRVASPHYAALAQPRQLTLAEIQKEVLDPDTVLLEYSLGEERSYLWAVTTDSIKAFRLPPRAEVERLAREYYELLIESHPGAEGESVVQRDARLKRVRAAYEATAERLSRVLLGDAAYLLGSKRLLLVKDGALQYIPFAALPEPLTNESAGRRPDPLVVRHEIVSLPSASVIALQRRELASRRPAPKQIAVLADPVFEATDPRINTASGTRREAQASTLKSAPEVVSAKAESPKSFERLGRMKEGVLVIPRLPFSRMEAEAIMSVATSGRGLKALDFDASKSKVTSGELSQYRIIHFATHGLISSESPELSGIVFSLVDKRGRPQSGLLGLNEIYNLKLNADLVVLSACQTALGAEVRGEGLDGIARGFMYAGSPRVVASLWKVDDVATAELMRYFYQSMFAEGTRPSAALRAAQLRMIKQKRWGSAYFWAPFVLQGEWR